MYPIGNFCFNFMSSEFNVPVSLNKCGLPDVLINFTGM